ncbi:hypothetical protein [Sorangium sp. So ce1000]|uniref:hypothetical protein n=1 Tax=Sorangium sp. So ce1000 TaxID=3133325 RepID=UPI003F63A18E
MLYEQAARFCCVSGEVSDGGLVSAEQAMNGDEIAAKAIGIPSTREIRPVLIRSFPSC